MTKWIFIPYLLNLLVLSLLSGCTGFSPQEDRQNLAPDPEKEAKRLIEQGDYAGGASEYLRLTRQSSPPTQQYYHVKAIDTYLQGDMVEEAKAEWRRFDMRKSFNLQIPIEFVHIQFALAEGHLAEAKRRLQYLNPNMLPKEYQIRHYQLDGKVSQKQGDYLTAAQKRIALQQLLTQGSKKYQRNQQAIWDSLANVTFEELMLFSQTPGDNLSGWISLAMLSRSAHPRRIEEGVAQWQVDYPNHTAHTFADMLLQQAATMPVPPRQVALLLPLDNQTFKQYAEAIRDGFFASIFQLPKSERPHIKSYSVSLGNVERVYRQAVDDGAEVIIGPLQKEVLNQLVQNKDYLPIPTLSLNYSGINYPIQNLFQFALSPEDEALEAAIKAWDDGHRSAAILVPQGSWGSRISGAFESEWRLRGGQVIAVEPHSKDIKKAVDAVVNAAQQFGSLDMLFMGTLASYARQFQPYFKRFYPRPLPAYAISKVYQGYPDPQKDIDLDGVQFPDMPWVLSPSQEARQLQQNLRASFGDKFNQFKRFYALGADAYNLATRLLQRGFSTGEQWPAFTGNLYVNEKGEIHRHLVWAEFINGQPQLLETGGFIR